MLKSKRCNSLYNPYSQGDPHTDLIPKLKKIILVIFWLIFIVNRQTDTLIYNLCDAPTSESGQFDNLIIKKSADPLGYRLVNPQLL